MFYEEWQEHGFLFMSLNYWASSKMSYKSIETRENDNRAISLNWVVDAMNWSKGSANEF